MATRCLRPRSSLPSPVPCPRRRLPSLPVAGPPFSAVRLPRSGRGRCLTLVISPPSAFESVCRRGQRPHSVSPPPPVVGVCVFSFPKGQSEERRSLCGRPVATRIPGLFCGGWRAAAGGWGAPEALHPSAPGGGGGGT